MSSPTKKYICNNCKHLKPISGGCAAFPENIPFGMGVLFQHNKPLPGQINDIVFERGEPNEI
jgi:hypothetical protein|tara:strand:+ start:1845 stop:2030 length:186 start_codon:yes stop_codon:yes gene_type:complete